MTAANFPIIKTNGVRGLSAAFADGAEAQAGWLSSGAAICASMSTAAQLVRCHTPLDDLDDMNLF
jgi:hypothetical protein